MAGEWQQARLSLPSQLWFRRTGKCFETATICTPTLAVIEIKKENHLVEENKLKILFVCTVNRMRSATAHEIFKNDSRFEVNSAGTDNSAATVISNELLDWADSIVVMEKHHRNFIRKKYPDIYKKKKIVCLYIPDEYDFMDKELISILEHKVNDVYKRGLI